MILLPCRARKAPLLYTAFQELSLTHILAISFADQVPLRLWISLRRPASRVMIPPLMLVLFVAIAAACQQRQLTAFALGPIESAEYQKESLAQRTILLTVYGHSGT